MKLLALVATLTLSLSAFAQGPAAQSVAKLLAPGSYKGITTENENCEVNVVIAEFISVSIKTSDSFMSFALSSTSNDYTASETDFSATQILRFPRYIQGGTRILDIRSTEKTTEVYISEIFLDHQGNDISSYYSCNITK